MTQNALLKALVAVLVVLNVTVVALTFRRLPAPARGPGDRPPLRETIVETLGLDPRQRAAFADLRQQHQRLMDSLTRARNDLLRRYLGNLKDDTADSAARIAGRQAILAIEDRRIEETYRHFERVRALARPDQRARFPQVIETALGILVGPADRPPDDRRPPPGPGGPPPGTERPPPPER
jgi:Spy/CpxP family protein refolding chaperone